MQAMAVVLACVAVTTTGTRAGTGAGKGAGITGSAKTTFFAGAATGNGAEAAGGATAGNGADAGTAGAEAADPEAVAAGCAGGTVGGVTCLAAGLSSSLIFSGFSSASVSPFLAASVSTPPHCISANSNMFSVSKKPNIHFITPPSLYLSLSNIPGL
jgi:hypothetical protein